MRLKHVPTLHVMRYLGLAAQSRSNSLHDRPIRTCFWAYISLKRVSLLRFLFTIFISIFAISWAERNDISLASFAYRDTIICLDAIGDSYIVGFVSAVEIRNIFNQTQFVQFKTNVVGINILLFFSQRIRRKSSVCGI